MSHSNDGRIFIDTESTPNVGIELVNDICHVLGRRSRDLGRLCSDTTDPMDGVHPDYGNKINVWTKFKSLRSPLFILTDAQREALDYGLSYPILRGVNTGGLVGTLYEQYENDAESDITKRMNGWEYQPPRGVTQNYTERFRALDFNGYWHRASIPLRAGGGGQENISTQMAESRTLAAIRRQSEDFDNAEIDIADMQNLEDYYFCLVGYYVFNGSIQGETNFIVSASSKIGNGVFSATIQFSGAHFPSGVLGIWYVYPCLCSVGGIQKYYNSGSTPSANYIPLPCSKRWEFNITSNVRYANLQARKNAVQDDIIKYRYIIHNESSGAFTFTGVQVWILHSGHTPDSSREADELVIYIGNVSVAANGEADSGFVDVSVQHSLYVNAVLFLTCTNGFDRVGPIAPLMPQEDPDIPITGDEY